MYLKEETVKNLEHVLGKPLQEIRNMDFGDEIAYVERKNKKNLKFSEHIDWRFASTGEPLITMGRCRAMEDVDRYFDKLLFPRSLLWKIKKLFYRKEK